MAALEKMIMNREKNRNTLIYYLYIRKSEKNQLTAEELEIIDKELAKEKEVKKGLTLQSTAECVTDQDANVSPLKKPKKLKKPITFRNIEENIDAEKLPAVITKREGMASPVRRNSKFSIAGKPQENSDKLGVHPKLSPVFQS